jgi:hypothetical protein
MKTDPVAASPARVRPTAATMPLQRQVWFSAVFLAWGAFELGRWREAAEPWASSSVFTGLVGALMAVAAVFGLRAALRQMGAGPSVDAPAR